MMQRIKKSNGLRISVFAAILIALLLCFTLGVAAADEQTEIQIDLGNLNFAGTGITVQSDALSKTYDGAAAIATDKLPALIAQPTGMTGATVAVKSAVFSSPNAGAGTLTITFEVSGENADNYVVKPLVVDAKILPKELAWATDGSLNLPYQPDKTAYTGYIQKADLPALTGLIGTDAAASSDTQVKVTFTASKVDNYTVQVKVNLDNPNYTAPLLTVKVKVEQIELTKVTWTKITGLKYGDAFSPVLIGYDATNAAHAVLTFEAPAGYVNGNAGTYTFTAKLLDSVNYKLADGAVGKTQAVTIAPVVYTVSFASKTVLTDGKTPNMITVLGDDIPVEVLSQITYQVNGADFTGSAETGVYEIVATLPASGNYSFLNVAGVEITSPLTATLTVKVDHRLVPVADAETSVILTANGGLGKNVSATAKKAEPKKPVEAKNFEALTIALNGVDGETYTIFVPISSSLYGKRYDEITAANVYVYVDGNPVEATSKGYTVTVGNGFVKIEGLASGEATFAIAPTYHPAFFTTALGIALLILLIILFLILMFILGLYVRRVLASGRTLKTVIETEAPAEEEAVEEEAPAEEPVEEEPVEEPAPEEVEEEAEADEEALAAAVASALEDVAEEEQAEEAPVEEAVVEEAVAEEAPAQKSFVEEVPEEEAPEEEAPAEEAPEEKTFGYEDNGIVFIDTQANPEEYQKMLDQEVAGEGQIIYRYKKSFMSRLVQSQGSVQDYYTEIKNALLSYKGVKSRVSSGYDAFNKGRIKVAKINAKVKTLYVYLAIDPASLQDTKYNVVDVSDKKKFADTPSLMKIRGDRKFKYTLELIERLCGEQLACKKLEKEPEDFHVPFATTSELVEAGLIREYAGLAPLFYEGTFAEPDEDPEEAAEAENEEEIAADAPATDETTPDTQA